jgi:hypothetical protein
MELSYLQSWNDSLYQRAQKEGVNYNQYFAASIHIYVFHGQMYKGLFYWPNHSQETQLSKKEEEE